MLDALKVLLWLKLKLQWRSYTRNTTTIIGIIVVVLFVVPAAFGIAFGCWAGFQMAPPANERILAIVTAAPSRSCRRTRRST
jgi:hypothetical protein